MIYPTAADLEDLVVARFKLPLEGTDLMRLCRSTAAVYGDGITIAEQPPGWLTIYKPQQKQKQTKE